METFNTKLKKELCQLVPQEHELALSFLSAIIKSIGEISKSKKGFTIVIKTELMDTYTCINKILSICYGTSADLNISDDVGYDDRVKYEITFPINYTNQILRDCEIVSLDEDNYIQINSGISKYLIDTEDKILAYIKGLFVACGTTNIVLSSAENNVNKSSGYHLEFVFSSEQLSLDFMQMLAEVNIFAKKVERKEYFVVYLQDFQTIITLLGLVKATKTFMDLQNENALREMRNNVNRQNNCSTANITKMVNASIEQLNAIKVIQDTVGIESLDDGLKEVCYLRLANPEETLESLVKLSMNKISKSGLYHRFQKIIKIAKEIKQ